VRYALKAHAPSIRVGRRRAFGLTLLALLAIIADGVVSWTVIRGADAATTGWTYLPGNWQALRAQWEYGHAVGAGLDFLAFVALVLSVLVGERPARYRNLDESSGGRGAPLRFMAVR